jgi:hypothetical protein
VGAYDPLRMPVPPVDVQCMYGDALRAPAPALRRSDRDPAQSVAIIVLAALLALAAGTGFLTASAGRSWFPSRWDPRVAPIADEVAQLRGLDFLHPVPIEYLSPAEFEKRLGTDAKVSASERADLTREEAVLRSLGLIGGKVDLLKALDTSESSSTLAYYDPTRQDIIVRGTILDAEHRVTIAHELTHVLQDQHFDLRKLQKAADDSDTTDSNAFKALVEGDAVRIQDAYLAQLPAADQKEYQRENDAEGTRVGKETASVPDIVSLELGAPYEFGPSTVKVLFGSGGNEAVNGALTGPVPSSEVFTETGDIAAPVAVDTPLIPPGGVADGHPETFGPFETYLTLAMRLDPGRALEAADTVGGGSAVTFKSGGSTCYRVSVAPTFEHSRPFLLDAVEAWAHGRPHTTVDADGDLVGFTACDPGRSAPDPSSARYQAAIELLDIRTGLTVGAAKNQPSGDLARCYARTFLETPGGEPLILAIGNGTPTAAQRAQVTSIAQAGGEACRADPGSGLK